MSKLVIGIIALIFGIVVGAIGGLSLGGGAMMGAGVATGLSAGICSTVTAAQEEGIMTSEQADIVLARAASDLGSDVEAPLVGTAAQCADVMSQLKSGTT